MPGKGIFTQTAVLLLERLPTERQVVEALREWNVRPGTPPDEPGWFMAEPPLLVDWRPEVNGLFVIDWISSSWPDGMGNAEDEVDLLAAWTMGSFGPFSFPGGLERAAQHAWHMEGAAELVSRHCAFLRIRSSYVLGAADENAPVMPTDSVALTELEAITKLAAGLIQLTEVIAYFNPNGEALYAPAALLELISSCSGENQPPLPAWVNVRFVTFAGSEWALMDTVGMEQLDLKDHEACFPNSIDPHEAASFLRNVTLNRLSSGDNIADGHTASISGGRHWRGHFNEDPRLEPPRETIRWFPVEGPKPPEILVPKKTKRPSFGLKLPWQK